MNAEIFRQTEGLLYRYWKTKLRIERLKAIIQQIHDQAEGIKVELSEASPVPRVVAKYRGGGGRVAPLGKSEGLESALADYDSLLFDLQARYVNLRRREWRLRIRVGRLEEEIAGIEAAVNQLTTDEKKIVEYRYLYRHSNYGIGKIMNFNEKTIRNKRRELVFKVADYLAKTEKSAKSPHRNRKYCGIITVSSCENSKAGTR